MFAESVYESKERIQIQFQLRDWKFVFTPVRRKNNQQHRFSFHIKRSIPGLVIHPSVGWLAWSIDGSTKWKLQFQSFYRNQKQDQHHNVCNLPLLIAWHSVKFQYIIHKLLPSCSRTFCQWHMLIRLYRVCTAVSISIFRTYLFHDWIVWHCQNRCNLTC